MDTPGADAKRCCGWSFHAGLITSILFFNRKAPLADYIDALELEKKSAARPRRLQPE